MDWWIKSWSGAAWRRPVKASGVRQLAYYLLNHQWLTQNVAFLAIWKIESAISRGIADANRPKSAKIGSFCHYLLENNLQTNHLVVGLRERKSGKIHV